MLLNIIHVYVITTNYASLFFCNNVTKKLLLGIFHLELVKCFTLHFFFTFHHILNDESSNT